MLGYKVPPIHRWAPADQVRRERGDQVQPAERRGRGDGGDVVMRKAGMGESGIDRTRKYWSMIG